MGFSPGFAYLEGLPEPAAGACRAADRPRPAVPAGSVALANGHAAVYPTASPGGWQLVGRTGLAALLVDAPALRRAGAGRPRPLHRGRRGRRASSRAPVRLPPLVAAGRRPRSCSRSWRRACAPSLQDGGRRGVAARRRPGGRSGRPGLVRAGQPARRERAGRRRARDHRRADPAAVPRAVPRGRGRRRRPRSASTARRRPPARCCHSPRARCSRSARSARRLPHLPGGGGRVPRPERLSGARASDELSGLGAGPLAARARSCMPGPWAPPLGDHLAAGAATELGTATPVELRVVPGPHAERFAPDALDAAGRRGLRASSATATGSGIRLRADDGAAPRCGVPAPGRARLAGRRHRGGAGAARRRPGGPLPDHATLGGYPVLAVVASADHGLLGQCAPGTRVRLVPVDLGEADGPRRRRRRALAGAVLGRYPLAAG